MGSALSPLLFCLALDPLLVYLNRIPRPLQVRAYMDDNQVAGEGLPRRNHRLAWVAQVQRAYQFYEEAGLLVVRHSCCVIGDSPDIPVGVTGGTSWRHAAGRALAALQPHNVYYAYPKEASPIEIPRAHLLNLWAGQPTNKLVQLVGAACGCKTKSAFIPDRPLALEELIELDASPWGAKILAPSTTVLGLPLSAL